LRAVLTVERKAVSRAERWESMSVARLVGHLVDLMEYLLVVCLAALMVDSKVVYWAVPWAVLWVVSRAEQSVVC
jgi:hypothetical protein